MFGRELAFGDCNTRGKLHYLLLGHDLVGLRIRSMHVKRLLQDIGEPAAILDAGCGDGAYSFYLARRFPGAVVHAIDNSQERIEACRKIQSRLRVCTIEFIHKSLTDLQAQGTYDLIVCIDVLEHIPEDELALRRLHDALQDQGNMILHVPQRRQLNHFVVRPLNEGYVHDHVRDEYTEQEIEEKIKRTGFCIVQKRYTFGWPGSLARELYYLLSQRDGLLKPIVRAVTFPFLLLLAKLDTLTANNTHQGFLFRLSKIKAETRDVG